MWYALSRTIDYGALLDSSGKRQVDFWCLGGFCNCHKKRESQKLDNNKSYSRKIWSTIDWNLFFFQTGLHYKQTSLYRIIQLYMELFTLVIFPGKHRGLKPRGLYSTVVKQFCSQTRSSVKHSRLLKTIPTAVLAARTKRSTRPTWVLAFGLALCHALEVVCVAEAAAVIEAPALLNLAVKEVACHQASAGTGSLGQVTGVLVI